MTTITIPLDKNPELAALLADKQPGEYFSLDLSIKSLDDQTVTARVESCDDAEKPDSADEEMGETDDSAAEEKTEPPAEKPSKMLARKLSSSYA